ncbi:DUF6234 family protein, partial [Streptomyces sp. NPDC005146]
PPCAYLTDHNYRPDSGAGRRTTRHHPIKFSSIAWTEHFLFGTFVRAGLAALTRTPWTAPVQPFAAGTLAVLLVLSQHDYDRTRAGPAPTPERR